MSHQYIDRRSGQIRTERFFGDDAVNLLYGPVREHAPTMFRALTTPRMSSLLGRLCFDRPSLLANRRARHLAAILNIDLRECYPWGHQPDTARELFERQIRYWQVRPMPDDPACVVAPADARVVPGAFSPAACLHIKDKFFRADELLGISNPWYAVFAGGDFAVFRLTPDKYHYNHVPVTGNVVAIYEVDGDNHSCNPGAIVRNVTSYSKNQRTVTIINTDVHGGPRIGLVAMLEVTALMIGEIVQCYSNRFYDTPSPVMPGMLLRRGQPKSLFRPGSSVVILLFQPDRVQFDADLVRNVMRSDVSSRYTAGFGQPLVETEVLVRSSVARRIDHDSQSDRRP